MSSSENVRSNRRTNGPIAVEALLSFDLPSSKAERPSRSRRFTSLPRLAPTMAPREFTTTTTSGSGLFQVELFRTPIAAPVPTADIGCALVKISASGPMPTSRYCDFSRVGENAAEIADTLGPGGRNGGSRIARLAQVAHGRECARDIEHAVRAHRHDGRPDAGPPHAADQRAGGGVGGEG